MLISGLAFILHRIRIKSFKMIKTHPLDKNQLMKLAMLILLHKNIDIIILSRAKCVNGKCKRKMHMSDFY